MRKTKIVATLGPATDDPNILRALILAGLDVARINFSHETHEEAVKRIGLLRQLCEETGEVVALLADTKGPEVRLGDFEGGKVELIAGDLFTLTAERIMGTASRATITYEHLAQEVIPGTRILLDDGLIELVVEQITGISIITRIINGGMISNRKGVNTPGVKLNIPYISGKDRSDLRFIAEMNFDFIAASFVRSQEDIKEMRGELHRMNAENNIRIIAKIENAEGVTNIDEILAASDGLMVARGDLGVELAYEELPRLQKELIMKAYQQGKNVITATQMLESMIHNPRPSRAEVSDVANAIYDGTSALMLSGETAMGKHPVEALAAMARIAERTERDIDYRERFYQNSHVPETSVTNAISHATVTTAHDLNATAILTVSLSGETARNISKFRPCCPIIACTPDVSVQRQLKMAWGVTPLLTCEEADTAALFTQAVKTTTKAGYASEGDLLVLTAGVPVGHSGTTNLLKVHEVGDKIPVI